MNPHAHDGLPSRAVAKGRHPSAGFIATKPLQIMTAMNVVRQLDLPGAMLVVTPTFFGASAVVGRLAQQDVGFASVIRARSRAAAVLSLAVRGATRVYLDSDVGLKTPLAMLLARSIRPRMRFSLYEEGLSLIEPQDDERPSRFFRAIGATSALGEATLTEEIWTYTPAPVQERLPDQLLRQIEHGLAEFVHAKRDVLREVFWPSFALDARQWLGASCCVYLSSWEVAARAHAYLAHTTAFTVWKLHPHIQGVVSVPDDVDQVIQASVPAELLIMELAKVFGSVEVIHHGSSTAGYIRCSNVHFVHVDAALARCPPTRV